MKYFATLIIILCLSWSTTQAQTPRFKLRPSKKKATTTQTIKKKRKVSKKSSKKTSITDRYRQRKNRRRKGRLNPRNKTRTRKTKS
ncbi:hypothetical protein BKI52_05350 [marine bacterium AO1-C]|nr:hypothetical protein BKI52_05350 [marine bacterium AO1-C]